MQNINGGTYAAGTVVGKAAYSSLVTLLSSLFLLPYSLSLFLTGRSSRHRWLSASPRAASSRRAGLFFPHSSLFALLLVVLTAGCQMTTVVRQRPDGTILITSPKDVVIQRLSYARDGANVLLEVEGYSSAANVNAIKAQFDGINSLAGKIAQGAAEGIAP